MKEWNVVGMLKMLHKIIRGCLAFGTASSIKALLKRALKLTFFGNEVCKNVNSKKTLILLIFV